LFLTSIFVHIFSLFVFFFGIYLISRCFDEISLLKTYVFSKEHGGFFLLSASSSYCLRVAKLFSIKTEGFKRFYFGPKKKIRGDRLIYFLTRYEVVSLSYKVCLDQGIDDTMIISLTSDMNDAEEWGYLLSEDLSLRVRIHFILKNEIANKKGIG